MRWWCKQGSMKTFSFFRKISLCVSRLDKSSKAIKITVKQIWCLKICANKLIYLSYLLMLNTSSFIPSGQKEKKGCQDLLRFWSILKRVLCEISEPGNHRGLPSLKSPKWFIFLRRSHHRVCHAWLRHIFVPTSSFSA